MANRDDKNIVSLGAKIKRIAQARHLRLAWYSRTHRSAKRIAKILKIPGAHNLSNALGAFTLARIIGVSERAIFRALARYRGAWRRMEYRGKTKSGAVVYDDYAHHPTEIKATLKAFREKYPKQPIVCVFQPHQAKRLAALFGDFLHAFDEADITLILPAYEVAGRDAAQTKLDSGALVSAIQNAQPGKRVFYLAEHKNLKLALKTLLSTRPSGASHRPPVLVMMGAGNIVNYTPLLFR